MKTKKSRAIWIAMLLLVPLTGSAFSGESASDLRKQIAKTEQEFFALYNKLNTNPQYEMVCKMERAEGSSFATRVCQPRYVEAAQQANASQRMQAATHAGRVDASNPNAAQPFALDDAYRQNVLDVMQKSPRLRALGEKRDALQARLDELTKK